MASLSTLRNKGGIIVTVVIGLALIAFVLGDLLSSGSTLIGSSQMTVGTIDGEKVSTMEYGRSIDELTTIQQLTTGQSGSTDQMNEAIRQQAWGQIVLNKAFLPAARDAGLFVSDAEMVSLLSGDALHLSPVIAQFQPMLDPNTGMFSPERLREFVAQVDADPSGQMRLLWNFLQNEAANWNLQSKFGALARRAGYVTTFEAEQMAKLTGTDYNVQFVVERFDQVADSTIAVTDADLRKYYDAHKAQYRRAEEVREIDYVTFEALPSAADYAAAEEAVHTMAAELSESESVQQYVSFNSHTPFNPRYYNAGEITGELGQFAFARTANGVDDRIYGPVLRGDQWTLARVADVQMMPDSIRLSSIVLEATQTAKVDSLVRVLRRGADFAQAALFNSLDQQGALMGGDVGMMDPQTLQPQFASAIKGASRGDIVTVNDPANGVVFILKVTELKGLSRKVQLGVINYNVEPSEITRNEAFTQANRFATAAVATNFDAAVTQEGVAKRVANIGPNDRMVGGIQSSRELARWAFNGKQGDLSNVMEFGNTFAVASLRTVRAQGVAPLDEVRDNVRQWVLTEKKGALISDKLWGLQTLDGQENILTGDNVNFSGFMAPAVGYDPAFVGGLAGIKEGQAVSKPIVGRIGVYLVQPIQKTPTPIDPAIEKARLQAELEQIAYGNAYNAITVLSNIQDTRYRFY